MRNLFVSSRTVLECPALGTGRWGTAYDASSGATLLYHKDRLLQLTKDLFLDEVELPPVSGGIVSAGMVSTLVGDELVIVTDAGGIYKGASASGLEEVGQMASGAVLAAAWNPERTALALIEADLSLTVLNSYFDTVRAPRVIMQDEGRSGDLVSVGWGKKETQFHGSAGKAAAQRKDVINEKIRAEDHRQASVVWHPDGGFFACNVCYEDGEGAFRKLFVYEHTGQCYSISEPVEGLLDSVMAWRPNGELIAAVQRTDTAHRVVFFERNGLRHGDFEIGLQRRVVGLQWSADSSVISICYEDGTTELWTMGNYHYYLKQTLAGTLWTAFHAENPRLLLSGADGALAASFIDGRVDQHGGTVAVIDGRSILVTPFALSNVPPPMSHGQVVYDKPVNKVALFDGGIRVVLASGEAVEQSLAITRDGVRAGEPRLIQNEEPSGDMFPWRAAFGEGHEVARSPEGGLYLDGECFLPNCTSFLLGAEFLMATTEDDRLRFYPLNATSAWAARQPDDNEERCRRVERGARIVTSVARDASVILQMPRGNLETIYPRAMVLSAVRAFLDQTEYLPAYLLCRRHRVDLNFLFDYNPQLFLATVGKFVREVRSEEYLSLFLMALNGSDCTASKYRGFDGRPERSPLAIEGKIDAVAEAFRAECLPTDVLITTHVIQKNIPGALQCIIDKAAVDASALEQSIKYLIFLADAEKLYREALGLYNLPLALSIARRSQLDPKEYSAQLDRFFAMSELERRFAIDDHLERYDRATKHLFGDPRWMAYVCEHGTYAMACSLLDAGSEEYRTLMTRHGDSLAERDVPSALAAYRLASNNERLLDLCRAHPAYWRDAIAVDMSRGRDFVALLVAKRMFTDAYFLAAVVVHDLELSVEVALKGCLWNELRLLLPVQDFTAFALAESERMAKDIQGMLAELPERARRIQSAQSLLLHRCTVELVSPSDSGAAIVDNMSEVSGTTASSSRSHLTGMTSASRLSTKSKKKADKQRLRDKPGSKHERQFLHSQFAEAIKRVAVIAEEAAGLIRLVLDLRLVQEARALQVLVVKIQDWFSRFIPVFNAKEDANAAAIDMQHPIVAAYMADVPLRLGLSTPAVVYTPLAILFQ